jgi:hypothetical protein
VKRGLALLALGLLALVLQAAAASVLPPAWVPDLCLLVVMGIGIALRSLPVGIVLAAALGYATDLLSGSLLGEHALLRMAGYGAARVGSSPSARPWPSGRWWPSSPPGHPPGSCPSPPSPPTCASTRCSRPSSSTPRRGW